MISTPKVFRRGSLLGAPLLTMLAVLHLASARSQESGPPASLVRKIPPRSADAMTGSAFVEHVRGMSPVERERAIQEQILHGNIPAFLRQLKPVELTSARSGSPARKAVVWAMPDYLAIGSDDDFVRMPMDLYTALAIAREFDCILPTRKIVDAIQRQAKLRFEPEPMEPGPRMTSTEYYAGHNAKIKRQRAGRKLGPLAAGHKKDLVLTNRLAKSARRVAIYGWHHADGKPIQPLSTVHGARYADYSHGVRLISATVFVDGEPRSALDLLEDPRTARLLTHEGSIPDVRRLMALERSTTSAAAGR